MTEIPLTAPQTSKTETETETVLNPFNIQLLSRSLEARVFPASTPSTSRSLSRLQMQTLEVAREHLRQHRIPFDEMRQLIPNVKGDFVPKLLSVDGDGSLDEHFRRMGQSLAEPYFTLAKEFAHTPHTAHPTLPSVQHPPCTAGWHRLNPDVDMVTNADTDTSANVDTKTGMGHWTAMPDGPPDEALVLDVETCPLIGPYPVLAVALGASGWYVWLSPRLFSNDPIAQSTMKDLPVGKTSDDHNPTFAPDEQNPAAATTLLLIGLPRAKLVIGHNVSFDRARIRDEYTLERGACRFLDTLSMHCAVAGISSQQRGLWNERKKRQAQCEVDDAPDELDDDDAGERILDNMDMTADGEEELVDRWGARSSMNNLADALRLHCNRRLDKSTRDNILLKLDKWGDIGAHLPVIMRYCMGDVEATSLLFSALLPKFLHKTPHPVSFAALLEMGSFVVPVEAGAWRRYIAECERLYVEATSAIEGDLCRLVEETLAAHPKDAPPPSADPWLGQLDWTREPVRMTKARFLRDGTTFAKGGEPRPIGNPLLFDKPAWYRKLLRAGQLHVTPRTAIVPSLLRLQWKQRPVILIPDHGWCIEDGADHGEGEGEQDTVITSPTTAKRFIHEGRKYVRIPHPGGRDENVGCLLTKNFLKHFELGDLQTDSPLIGRVMEVNARFSFWTSYRERIMNQFVVQVREGERMGECMGERMGENTKEIARERTGENTKENMENTKENMESMESMESNISSPTISVILPTVIPMGTVTRRAVEKTWLTASNAKERLVGSELKTLVRAPPGWCFVGADVDSQELWIGSLLGDAQFASPGATALGWMTLQGTKADGTDLHSRTASILGMTRDHAKIFNYGRIYGAGVKYAAQLLLKFNPRMTATEAASRAASLYYATKGRRVANRGDAFVSYAGGSESFMFNQMEAIARAETSRTPVLGAEISEGLRAAHVNDHFMTSRVNWVVQSSGVDYLHMLLVAVGYLFREYAIRGRIALTIHDELRFLVWQPDRHRAALALQIANLWTRAAFVQALGMSELPLSVAFFSAVDFDHVLRKEVSLPCTTPSNPTAIAPGEALDIYQLLRKCSSLEPSDAVRKEFIATGNRGAIASQHQRHSLPRHTKQFTPSPTTSAFSAPSVADEQRHLALLRKQVGSSANNATGGKSETSHQHKRTGPSSAQKSSSSAIPPLVLSVPTLDNKSIPASVNKSIPALGSTSIPALGSTSIPAPSNTSTSAASSDEFSKQHQRWTALFAEKAKRASRDPEDDGVK